LLAKPLAELIQQPLGLLGRRKQPFSLGPAFAICGFAANCSYVEQVLPGTLCTFFCKSNIFQLLGELILFLYEELANRRPFFTRQFSVPKQGQVMVDILACDESVHPRIPHTAKQRAHYHAPAEIGPKSARTGDPRR